MPLWQPSAPLNHLKSRASLLAKIRDFFAKRQVMEVETPLLSHTSVTDPHIQSIATQPPCEKTKNYYLQTSPEYAMKRLLAAGSGPIYQLTKAFRYGERGRNHNPEFTLLEWYRLEFTHHDLMDEMDDLLHALLASEKADRLTYSQLFISLLGIDPLTAEIQTLEKSAKKNKIALNTSLQDKDDWLNLLFTHLIEPQLGTDRPCFIYDYPPSQAALARISGNPPLASRFEVYFKGKELANGFHELQDAHEQYLRFEKNVQRRAEWKLPDIPMDDLFLAALEHGLPDCAGVALGIDRLIMLATHSEHIKEVISFDFERA